MGMARSTYFYELSKTDAVQERNALVGAEIQAVFTQNKGRYGVRRVHIIETHLIRRREQTELRLEMRIRRRIDVHLKLDLDCLVCGYASGENRISIEEQYMFFGIAF